MRLSPIEKPPGLVMRLGYWMSRKMLGKVMMPMKVVYARVPELLTAQRKLYALMEKNDLGRNLSDLVSTWVSSLNGCAFCTDLHQAQALKHKNGARAEQLGQLSEYATSPLFSTAERAALAYAEEMTVYRQVEDATFEALKAHYTERQIVQLTWLVAYVGYFNLMARVLEFGSDGFCPVSLPAPRKEHSSAKAAAHAV